ncbi:MAG: hypothetical protein WCC17_05555 [Candidatus Nitrosopolaris sp.]
MVAQVENGLPSKLHSKLLTPEPVKVNLTEVESVVLPFCIVTPFPSTTEVIDVAGWEREQSGI